MAPNANEPAEAPPLHVPWREGGACPRRPRGGQVREGGACGRGAPPLEGHGPIPRRREAGVGRGPGAHEY